jgi:hypothetical protein
MERPINPERKSGNLLDQPKREKFHQVFRFSKIPLRLRSEYFVKHAQPSSRWYNRIIIIKGMVDGMNRNTLTVILLITMALLASCAAPRNAARDASGSTGVQAQLSALQPPQGSDPRVFQLLKDELARQLAQNGSKSASAPPDPANTANDIADLRLELVGASDWTLTWHYRNVGDYDQNGIIGVADITPIAMHFGHDPGTDAMDEVIHPGPGKVGVTDITAIAMNYGMNVAGYAVMTSTNGVDWTELARFDFITAGVTARKQISYILTAPVDLDMFLVRAYDSTEAAFGKDSNAVRYAASSLTVVLVTSASGGTGAVDDPYVVNMAPDTYDIRVYYDRGGPTEADVTNQVTFDTFPPAFISFEAGLPGDPQVMTVDNAMAGNFNINAIWGDVAPIASDPLYFRVEGGLPG